MCSVVQASQILCDSMACNPPGSSVHVISQARILERVAIPFSRNLTNPGIELKSPALQADSSPSEHQGSPKVKVAQLCPTLCSHGLQGIFPTQGSNQGLPLCRWILYQLSHQGSPRKPKLAPKHWS